VLCPNTELWIPVVVAELDPVPAPPTTLHTPKPFCHFAFIVAGEGAKWEIRFPLRTPHIGFYEMIWSTLYEVYRPLSGFVGG
jgi:hypothetical protein